MAEPRLCRHLGVRRFYLCRKNFSVLMPLLPSTKDELARVIFLFSAIYAAGQFMSGGLAGRFQARTIVALGMFRSDICSAALASVQAGAAGPASLLAMLACVFLLVVRDCEWSTSSVASPRHAWREVLSCPSLRSIVICYFCLKLMRYTFLFWLPLYLVERLHYSASRAGYLSSAYELVRFAGLPLAGILTFGRDTLMSGAVTPAANATAAGFAHGLGSAGQLISPILVAALVPWTGWRGLFSIFAAPWVVGGASLAIHWNRRAYRSEVRFVNA
jgi:sugar phosphate permease